MRLNLQPAILKNMNCLEADIVSTALWWRRNYELLFLNSWCFSFFDKVNPYSTLGERIRNKHSLNTKFFEMHHGIKLQHHEGISADFAIEIIKEELKNHRPVEIIIDHFWCPWLQFVYQRNHGSHSCLVIGFDEKEETIICIDAHPVIQYNACLSLENFSKAFSGDILTFQLLEVEDDAAGWKEILREATEFFYNSSSHSSPFEAIRAFANEVELFYDANLEFKDYENILFRAPILWNLIDITNGRAKFSMALKYLSNISNSADLSNIATRFENAYLQWDIVKAMFAKTHYLDNYSMLIPKIVSKLLKVADFEEEIYIDLINVLNDVKLKDNSESTVHKSNQIRNIKHNGFVFLDLSLFFNNQGFGLAYDNKCTANFTGTHKYFYGDNIEVNKFFDIHNMNFQISNTNSSNDNVTCIGQFIEIAKDNYYEISILGCSEFGNFSDFLTVKYDDTSEEEISIGLSNLTESTPVFNELIVWEGEYGDLQKSYLFKGKLFGVRKSIINCHKSITGIHLPSCPNMHIFAITLSMGSNY